MSILVVLVFSNLGFPGREFGSDCASTWSLLSFTLPGQKRGQVLLLWICHHSYLLYSLNITEEIVEGWSSGIHWSVNEVQLTSLPSLSPLPALCYSLHQTKGKEHMQGG